MADEDYNAEEAAGKSKEHPSLNDITSTLALTVANLRHHDWLSTPFRAYDCTIRFFHWLETLTDEPSPQS
jgi:hypothetical protein